MKLFEIKKRVTDDRDDQQTTYADPNTELDLDLDPKLKHNVTSSKTTKPSKGTWKTASPQLTRSRVDSIVPNQQTVDNAPDLEFRPDEVDVSDEISDEQAMRNAGYDPSDVRQRPEQLTPEMLPAVMSKALTTTSKDIVPNKVEIEWHMVKHLPGYLSQPIRALGRQVFGPFTNTKIEDIQVIATLGGSGPNSEKELNVMANYLQKAGTKNASAELYFKRVFPGYQADIAAYSAEGYTFLVVQDHMGKYIYSWPQSDSKTLPTGMEKRLQ